MFLVVCGCVLSRTGGKEVREKVEAIWAVLPAAALVDGFVPTQASFEQGELVVSNSFLVNSLIEQYARAAPSLADHDPACSFLTVRLVTIMHGNQDR